MAATKHRLININEREAQLNAWDAKLEQRQRELDDAIVAFRDEMRMEIMRLASMQKDVARRVVEVEKRETELREHERILSAQAEAFERTLDDYHRSLEHFDIPVHQENSTPQRKKNDPKYYEGPVNVDEPSHVEEIESDSDAGGVGCRGIQASPAFEKMDPNDSGLFFLRGETRAEHLENLRREKESKASALHADDGPVLTRTNGSDPAPDDRYVSPDNQLQDLFDRCVEYLLAQRGIEPLEIEQWLDDGMSAEELIEYAQQCAEEDGVEIPVGRERDEEQTDEEQNSVKEESEDSSIPEAP